MLWRTGRWEEEGWQWRNNLLDKYTGEKSVYVQGGVLTGSHKQVASISPQRTSGDDEERRRRWSLEGWTAGRAPAASLTWQVKIKVNRKGLAHGCCRDSCHPLRVNWTVNPTVSFPWLDERERQRQRELWGYSLGDHSVQRQCSGKLTPDGEGERC